jgi:cellulose synthase/poly-beta-1,6-N-acetylglucosamine synthase-like glycosyltransferase
VRISVVVPAYEAWATLTPVLTALEPQVAPDPEREVVVVESSGGQDSSDLARRWPWARFLCEQERTLPGRARNLGVAATSGELVAFLDADAIPAPDWLDELERGLADGDMAAGAVENGTPHNLLGTAGYLLEFSEWLPAARRTHVPHGATCNLIVRRTWLERAGGFPEDVWPGEDTILTFAEGRAKRLRYVRSARVRHLNRTGLPEFLRHQHRLGVAFAHVCGAVDFPHGWASARGYAPLAVVLRLAALGRRLRGRDRALGIALLPLLTLGLCAWATGIAARRDTR